MLADPKLNGWVSSIFRERPYLTEHQERWRKTPGVIIHAHTCAPALLHGVHMDTQMWPIESYFVVSRCHLTWLPPWPSTDFTESSQLIIRLWLLQRTVEQPVLE